MWSRDARARLLAIAVAVACCMAAARCSAQGTTADAAANGAMPSCVSKLAPCQGYLNATDATTVPDTCCDPLKEAATTEAACVCAILMNKAALQAFGVKPEQGVLLAKRCGVTTDASTCAKYAAGAGAGKDAATSGSTAPSSGSTGTATSTAAKPTASAGTMHHLSLKAASSLVAGFSFIWWSIVA